MIRRSSARSSSTVGPTRARSNRRSGAARRDRPGTRGSSTTTKICTDPAGSARAREYARGLRDPSALATRAGGRSVAVTGSMAFRKILCPIDFSPASDQALRTAVQLAKADDAELVLAHSWYVPPIAYAGEAWTLSADVVDN